jgi:hypothetical protein
MLKIVTTHDAVGDATLYLDGDIVGPWIDELGRVCEALLSGGSRLDLDLSNVSFVSRDAIELLSDLRDRRARLLHCSAFVAEQLKARA